MIFHGFEHHLTAPAPTIAGVSEQSKASIVNCPRLFSVEQAYF